jgi:hypothetical protein
VSAALRLGSHHDAYRRTIDMAGLEAELRLRDGRDVYVARPSSSKPRLEGKPARR